MRLLIKSRCTMRPSIDLVLVTGAGASHDFGGNRRPLPLMPGLSEALVRELQTHPGYLEATRLQQGLDGQEFERRLGRFLQAVLAYSQIDSVLDATLRFGGEQYPGLNEHTIARWYETSKFQFDQIIQAIYNVLYAELSMQRVSVQTAADAYRTLLEAIGIEKSHHVVVATTNYDEVAEHALQWAGWHPDAGDPRYSAAANPAVSVDGLLDGMPRHIPVLHLHGRLGWYRRPGSQDVYVTSHPTHHPDFGVPVMVLPDPDKTYDNDLVIASLWAQFEEALRSAHRVLILGHSLNDAGLVQTLVRNVQPLERIGVALLPGEQPGNWPGSPDTLEVVRTQLGNAALIPLRFTSPLDVTESGIEKWVEHTRAMGPRPGTG
jgi:hypothetical protein